MPGERRETGKYGTLDAALARLAAQQHGVFTLDQVGALGLTSSAVRKRVATGRLHGIYRGVYALTPPKLLTPKGRRLAAALACGPDAVLSHREAAALHGLRQNNRPRFEVTVPGRSTRCQPGIDVHRSTTLAAADITIVDGIPCTSVARTLLDLAAVVPQNQLENALNQAEALKVLDGVKLNDQLARNPRHRGAAALRKALAFYDSSGDPDETGIERVFFSLVRQAGLPVPERQPWLILNDGEPAVQPDFLWRDQRLILETDGRRQHGTRRAFETDRRKDQRLIRAGWRVVRVTWWQLEHEPAYVVKLVADLLRDQAA